MEPLTLLRDAGAAGLRLMIEGDDLVIKGPLGAEPVVRRLAQDREPVFAILSIARRQADLIVQWAGQDLGRWQRLHSGLTPIYRPAIERYDVRDLLVSWVAAHRALLCAQRDLARLASDGRWLSPTRRDETNGRKADISFWNRLLTSVEPLVPFALAGDEQAAQRLASIAGVMRLWEVAQ